MSQRFLAHRSGAGQAQVARYERGVVSPTLETLDRLLAACGLQARVTLEPLLADVDARLEELLQGTCGFDTQALPNLIRTLDDHPEAHYGGWSGAPSRKGAVRWALDGAMALQLHGLAAPVDVVEVVVVADEAARWWLEAISAHGSTRRGRVDWREDPWPVLREAAEQVLFSLLALLKVRFVEEPPASVPIAVAWHDAPVPVATVDEVERGHPAHEEVLRRWRTRA